MEAVKEFAGMDESKPVIYPKAEALLTRMGRTLAPLPDCHFSLRDCRPGAPACPSNRQAGALALQRCCGKAHHEMGIASELRRLLGNDAVADDPQTLADHSGDKWFAHETPEVVVFARSSDEVKKLLRFA